MHGALSLYLIHDMQLQFQDSDMHILAVLLQFGFLQLSHECEMVPNKREKPKIGLYYCLNLQAACPFALKILI